MTQPLYLSRVRLRSDAPIAALASVLVPDDEGQRLGTVHQLLWTLFADHPDRQRDFLWREEKNRRFMLLSQRPPDDRHNLFEIEVKTFQPDLRAGDRLAFALRANPVVSRSNEQGKSQRHDVVMDRLHKVPAGQRAAVRDRIAQEAANDWIRNRAPRCGFELDGPIVVDGYTQVRIPRKKARDATFSVMDFTGHLVVTDADQFISTLASGLGKAKSFGCGLMLIRRA